jgi:regulator of RNase E activity RraB
MDIITGDLEGVRIKRNTVRLEIDPLVIFESSLQAEAIDSEDEEVVSLIDAKTESVSQDWSCHFQDLAKLEAFRRSTPDLETRLRQTSCQT